MGALKALASRAGNTLLGTAKTFRLSEPGKNSLISTVGISVSEALSSGRGLPGLGALKERLLTNAKATGLLNWTTLA